MKLTVKRILKEIGCDKLKLYNGKGYWYFVYDDAENEIYADHSVQTFLLSFMTLEQWVDEGRYFLSSIDTKPEAK